MSTTSAETSAKSVARRPRSSSGVSLLDLPLDYPRPAAPSGRRARHFFNVPPAIAEALDLLAGEGATDATIVLLTAFLGLLGRFAGQTGVTLGASDVADDGAGLLAVTVRLEGDLSFRDLVRQTAGAVRQAALKGVLADPASADPPLRAAFATGPVGGAGLDLVLEARRERSGWTGVLDADEDLFAPTTAVRLLAGWLRVLKWAAAAPETRWSHLPWLSESERHQLVVEWNDTAIADTGNVCLHHLAEDCAWRQPDAVAWSKDAESLTWGELDRRANRLAHHLRRLGVRPEVLVGVFLQQSLSMVVALAAIHKAGGAYVPLDPHYPAERLAFMLEDSGAPVLISQSELLPQLARHDLITVVLDPGWEERIDEPESSPDAGVTPDNLAYLIYTSGSTGRPKGVAIRHRSGVVLMRWAAEAFSPGEAAGVLGSTSISFDVSVFELFLPAVQGTMGIFGRHALALIDMPNPERVTLVSTAPSGIAEVIRVGSLPPSVHTVCLAGEALPTRVAEALYRIPTVERVWNLYGPTEDTTYSTQFLVPRNVPGPPAIGRPLPGGRVHLLDADRLPVPLGSRGEILLGGEGVARGYFGRPELTAERFIPDPFGTVPGGRLYRTGDLGRYRPDGDIEYLGRIDQQVKIRGLRIEPGEIEEVLTRCPGVQEGAVVVQQRHTGPQLVAFYILQEGATLPVARLRRFLQNELPSYMVPARFVPLESLPSTPSGKIDRKLLASLPSDPADTEMVLPRTRLELELRQIWEEVLHVTPISITDNFFALGGDSLLAITLMLCLRDRFGRELAPSLLLQAPTIELFTEILSKEMPRLANPSLVPLQPKGSKPAFFCVHGAGGNVFQLVELARTLGEVDPERPFWGIQAKSLMGEGEPLESIEEMADYYIAAIRDIQPKGPYHLGGYSMGGIVAYQMALRLLDQGESVGLLAMLDAPPRPATRVPPMDLGRLVLLFARELLVPITAEDLKDLTPDEGLARVLSEGIRARRVPRDISFQDARRYLRLMETTVEASRRYHVDRAYPGTLTIFAGQELNAGLDGSWDEVPTSRETIPVPGDHRSMFEQPHVGVLAGMLRESLDRAFEI